MKIYVVNLEMLDENNNIETSYIINGFLSLKKAKKWYKNYFYDCMIELLNIYDYDNKKIDTTKFDIFCDKNKKFVNVIGGKEECLTLMQYHGFAGFILARRLEL